MSGPVDDSSNEEGLTPPCSRSAGEVSPSKINLTPSNLTEQDPVGNQKVACGGLRLDCGHGSIEECVRSDLDAMLGRNPGKPDDEKPHMADFLRTRELSERLRGTVISHPLPQGAGAASSHIDRVVFWEIAPDREERRRTYAILRLLHRRGLLPLGALIIARLEGGLSIGIDAPDPEQFAAYQKKLNGLQWAFTPWNVRASGFDETMYRLAEELKLGIVYHDELPGERLPS